LPHRQGGEKLYI